jgi:hypothetical protein
MGTLSDMSERREEEPRMSPAPYIVSVVLDREFGSRLLGLLESGPVWVVDSPTNREVAQKLWAEFPDRNHLTGITVFKTGITRTPAETLISEIATIDLHHGEYSADPPYTAIRVFGCEPEHEVRNALAEFGFDSFRPTVDGFEAVRPLPPPSSE